MKIDGNKIAEKIFRQLFKKVELLKKDGITPHLAVVLIGGNPASKAYVLQKEQKAELIGIKATVYKFNDNVKKEEIKKLVRNLNKDANVDGIIIQRPLPSQIDEEFAQGIVSTDKDVDGFRLDSPFNEPVAEAVFEILKEIFRASNPEAEDGKFEDWLNAKDVVVVGKGKTGGLPVMKLLKRLGCSPLIVDSKTQDPAEVIEKADILISTVGKPVIRSNEIKKRAIVIGIGMHKGADKKLHPDYNQEEIAKIASYYTPVPGGVGPVNVAMLLKNLVEASNPK